AEDGIRGFHVTGVQTCALPISLESLAHQLQIDDGFIIPLLDARRMEVYSAVFDKNLHQVRDTEAEIIDMNSFSDFLAQGKTYFRSEERRVGKGCTSRSSPARET